MYMYVVLHGQKMFQQVLDRRPFSVKIQSSGKLGDLWVLLVKLIRDWPQHSQGHSKRT